MIQVPQTVLYNQNKLVTRFSNARDELKNIRILSKIVNIVIKKCFN